MSAIHLLNYPSFQYCVRDWVRGILICRHRPILHKAVSLTTATVTYTPAHTTRIIHTHSHCPRFLINRLTVEQLSVQYVLRHDAPKWRPMRLVTTPRLTQCAPHPHSHARRRVRVKAAAWTYCRGGGQVIQVVEYESVHCSDSRHFRHFCVHYSWVYIGRVAWFKFALCCKVTCNQLWCFIYKKYKYKKKQYKNVKKFKYTNLN